jgi:hypothetical protein
MFLKNYTSDVPVPTTIMRIEGTLIHCGVKGIEKQYDKNSRVEAVTFTIDVGDKHPMRVKLPVREEEVLQRMWMEYVGTSPLSPDGQSVNDHPHLKRKVREDFRAQAQRTAWRIMQDWVEIQMSLILLKQADVREVFLSYIMHGNKTVFERIAESGFKALLPEKSS